MYKMANMSLKLTLLAMVPMALMIALSALVGKFMAKNGSSGKRCMRRFPISRKKLFGDFRNKGVCKRSGSAVEICQTKRKERKGQRRIYKDVSTA